MTPKILSLILLLLSLPLASARPIEAIALLKAKPTKPLPADKPVIEIDSQEAASKYFKGEELEKLAKLDFDEVKVLVISWKGSGRDKLDYAVLESDPEQLIFDIISGRTRDLRSHCYVYQVRKNVVWSPPKRVRPKPLLPRRKKPAVPDAGASRGFDPSATDDNSAAEESDPTAEE